MARSKAQLNLERWWASAVEFDRALALSFSMLRLRQHDRLETLLRERSARCGRSVGAQNPETFLARGLLGLCLSEKADWGRGWGTHRQGHAGLAVILTATTAWCSRRRSTGLQTWTPVRAGTAAPGTSQQDRRRKIRRRSRDYPQALESSSTRSTEP